MDIARDTPVPRHIVNEIAPEPTFSLTEIHPFHEGQSVGSLVNVPSASVDHYSFRLREAGYKWFALTGPNAVVRTWDSDCLRLRAAG